jgi:hypothetical protein
MLDIVDLYSGFVSGAAGVLVGQPLAVVIVRLQVSGLWMGVCVSAYLGVCLL